jgi:hypothetical protein
VAAVAGAATSLGLGCGEVHGQSQKGGNTSVVLECRVENVDGTSRYLRCQTEHGIATENEHSIVGSTHQCAINDLGHF